MIRVAAAICCLCLSGALHVWAMGYLAPPDTGEAGGGGAQGTSVAYSLASQSALAATVRKWRNPPEAAEEAVRAPVEAHDAAPASPAVPKPGAAAGSPGQPTPGLPVVTAALEEPRPAVERAAPPPAPERTTASEVPSSLSGAASPKDVVPPVRLPPAVKRAASPSAPPLVARGSGATGGSGDGAVAGAAANALRNSWAGAIRSRIAQYHRVPRAAAQRDLSGRVVLRITVLPNGRLSRIELLRSSGTQLLDEAAIENVRRAGRMPQAPRGIDRELVLDLPLSFHVS